MAGRNTIKLHRYHLFLLTTLSFLLLSLLFYIFTSTLTLQTTTHATNPNIDYSFVSSLEKFLTNSKSTSLPDDTVLENVTDSDINKLDDSISEHHKLLLSGLNEPVRVYVYNMPAKFTYDLLWLFIDTYKETNNLTSNGSPVHRLIEQHSVDYWLWADLIAPEEERVLRNVVRVRKQEEADLFYIPLFTTISYFVLEKQQCKALYRPLKLVMDSIIWAFRHTERNIAETGLNLLLEMMKKFQTSEFCQSGLQDLFCDYRARNLHKPGFKLHVLVLHHLFCLLETSALTEPLWDTATVPYPYPNNSTFAREYTITLLSSSLPNMTSVEFVTRLFESRSDLSNFKDQIRDFLVQSKEFSAQDNKDLYAEEAADQRERERQRMLSITGLIAPNEIQDEMVDS